MLIVFDLDDTLYSRSRQVKDETAWKDAKSITAFPGVHDFLSNFEARKVLVTKEGMKGLQNRKIDALGIRKHFDEIHICNGTGDKKAILKDLKKRNRGEEIWVVGDRLDSEIRFGNELGLKTIWMRHGKYKNMDLPHDKCLPHYEVRNFKRIFEIL